MVPIRNCWSEETNLELKLDTYGLVLGFVYLFLEPFVVFDSDGALKPRETLNRLLYSRSA